LELQVPRILMMWVIFGMNPLRITISAQEIR